MLEYWSGPSAMVNQIWVLWEFFITVESNTPYSILLPPHEMQRFLDAINNGGEKLREAVWLCLASIDCASAVADNDEDQVAILARVKEAGQDHVTSTVIKAIREWFCSVMGEHAQALLLKLGDGSKDRLNVCSSVNIISTFVG